MIDIMCGRLALFGQTGVNTVNAVLSEDPFASFKARIPTLPFRPDIRPSEPLPVIMGNGEVAEYPWWFVPRWASDPTTFRKQYATFNARIETVTTSRTFGAAWQEGHRCLIPMRGYYEWQALAGSKRKQRHYLAPFNDGWLCAAGLWEHWEPKYDGAPLTSCTMLVREANPTLVHIHDRSPAFVSAALAKDWLRATPDEAMALLHAVEWPDLVVKSVEGPMANAY